MALEKARITNDVTGEPVWVMFNPEDYTVNKDNNFAQIAVPGLSAPILQFVNGNMGTLDMELFFDTVEEHREGAKLINAAGDDVRRLTRQITDLMVIDSATHAPPRLLFTWGTLSFCCVLARVNQRFTMFLPDGTPVRATLQVTFNEYTPAAAEAREIKRETADYSKQYEVGQSQTLSGIAAHVYGNPTLWRPIALHNGIDRPRALTPGVLLLIPQLPYRDPATGEVYQAP